MNPRDIIDRIRKLDIPAKVKADLLMLWQTAKRIAERILAFLERNRHFVESMMLGAMMAFLLSRIPWIGTFLALCALVTAAAIGLMRQMHADFERLFETA